MAIKKPSRRRGKPAETPEAREMQLVSLAHDLAEQQMIEGTASAQVITHFLKLGSSREQLEQARLVNDNALTKIKAEQLAANDQREELYSNALEAMRSYTGQQDTFEE